MMVTSKYDSLHAFVLELMVEIAAVKKLQNNGDDNGNLKEKLGKILHFKVRVRVCLYVYLPNFL